MEEKTMFRKRLLTLAALLALFGAAAPAARAETLAEQAARDIADQVVAQLPEDDVHLRLLAVTDIEGDHDGLLTRALNVALSEKTSFVLIEKENIDKVLDEQGWQLGDLVNPEARVQFGELLAAEGIVFGDVLDWSEGFKSADIRVHIQVDDVQRGSIVLSKEFLGRADAPERAIWIAGIALLVVLVLGFVLVRRVMVRKTGEKIEDAVDKRLEAIQHIRKAARQLGDAREHARKNGSPELAEQVKAVEAELDRLRLAVDSAPAGRIFDRAGVHLNKDDYDADKKLGGLIHAITGYCDHVYDRVHAGEMDAAGQALNDARTAIKDVHGFFSSRTAG
jgi:hypothetical protein